MHLAETDEFKARFQLFVSFPKDEGLRKVLEQQISGLYAPAAMEHVSFSVDGVQGWAFFADDEEQLSQDVVEYIKDRLMSIITHEYEFGPAHDRSSDYKPFEGIVISENVEVDCFYFYDNPRWYE